MKRLPAQDDTGFSDIVRMAADLARRCPHRDSMANRFFSILNAGAHIRGTLPDLGGRRGLLWRYGYSIASVFAVLGLSLLAWPKGKIRPGYGRECDVLIVSHLVSEGHLDSDGDFYFGSLPSDLAKAGIKPVTVLVNHIKAGPKTARRAHPGVVVLNGWLSPLAEMSNFVRLLVRSFSIPVDRTAKPEARRLARQARAAAFDHRALGYLRVHDQLERAIDALKPSVILHTFEGHGWERMLAQTAHAREWPIRVVGYSHGVLLPAPRAIDFKLGHGRDPDNVMLPGTVTAGIFRRESEFEAEQISVLGSPKLGDRSGHGEARKGDSCLIVTQGEMSEVELMADAMVEVARKLPEIRFLLRLHPLITGKKARSTTQSLGSTPPNFKITESGLDEDLDNARWLVYRGSSVVLNGLERGIRPIYLNTDGSQASNDPLVPEVEFRRIADTVEQVADFIRNDAKTRGSGVTEGQNTARTFAGEYFTHLNPAFLIDIIQSQ